ncbi:MAG: DegQ family serine endoprotease [Desulfobacterales bacterium]
MFRQNCVRKKPFCFAIMPLESIAAGGFALTLLFLLFVSPATAKEPLAIPGSFSKLVKNASPSVVNISTIRTVRGPRQVPMPFGSDDPFRDFFERFFGGQMPREFKQQSLGTGFIIDPAGYILTNNHVVAQTDQISVRLEDQKEFTATIVGRDPMTDLALIRIKTDATLNPLPLGDSNLVEVGDWVVAIGNPFGLGNTVTAGIVSAKYRQIGAGPYENFIQTDTPINPGNSGGPLLNTAGEVIGINTAIFSESGGSVGIGFAIPINMAKDLLPQLRQGKVTRGWLGVVIQPITPELKEKLNLKDTSGALVSDVASGGPAYLAGIRRGDVILSFDGKDIKKSSDLPYIVAATPVGKVVTVKALRRGTIKTFQVKVQELKEEKETLAATEQKTPRLGMVLEEVTPALASKYNLAETRGLVVVDIEDGSAAALAGLRPGDIILEVDNEGVETVAAFADRLRQYKKGDTLLLLVNREGNTVFLTLIIS